jgi:hypothetical protein
MVESCGQDVGIGQRLNLARLKILNDLGAFCLRCFANDCFGGDALLAQFISDMVGVINSDTEEQPRAPISGEADRFLHSAYVLGECINRLLKLTLNEFAAALMNTVSVQF